MLEACLCNESRGWILLLMGLAAKFTIVLLFVSCSWQGWGPLDSNMDGRSLGVQSICPSIPSLLPLLFSAPGTCKRVLYLCGEGRLSKMIFALFLRVVPLECVAMYTQSITPHSLMLLESFAIGR